MNNQANPKFKDTLFTYMFKDKSNALKLYNVLNGSDYDNPDEITITTLENVVFLNRYNDLSYLFNSTLQLYEHQSTFNPNMPLRNLFYFANTYEKLIAGQKPGIFGSALIKIPTPKCVVFYNGEGNQPDSQVLRLSDSFENRDVEGDLELCVLMLNVNAGHNDELLQNCEPLYGYSLYISKFREYNSDVNNTMTEAAIKALDYCIEAGVMKEFFIKRRHEVVGMILEEYTTEHVERYMKDMEEELAAKNEQLAAKDDQLAAKDDQLTVKDKQLAAQAEEIARLKALLEKK